MINLAEKNLTGEYGGKLMNYRETRRGKQYTLPKSEELQCTDLCTKEYSINPAATEYLYFAVDEYRGSKLSYDGGDGVSVSVLGRDTNNEWHVLQSGNNSGELIFTDDMAGIYNLIAFAVANSNIEHRTKTKDAIMKAVVYGGGFVAEVIASAALGALCAAVNNPYAHQMWMGSKNARKEHKDKAWDTYCRTGSMTDGFAALINLE